jgi:hypothetical protein
LWRSWNGGVELACGAVRIANPDIGCAAIAASMLVQHLDTSALIEKRKHSRLSAGLVDMALLEHPVRLLRSV